MGNADSSAPAGDTPSERKVPHGVSRKWVWRAIFTGSILLTALAFALATTIRIDNGLGLFLGVDWNAVGDALWAILIGLSEIGPLATTAAAVVAAIALSQKWKADDRTAWWSRVQWAADHSLSKDDETQLIGMAAVSAISASPAPSPVDRELMQAIGQRSKKEEMAQGRQEKDNGDRQAAADHESEGGDNVDIQKTEEDFGHGGRPQA